MMIYGSRIKTVGEPGKLISCDVFRSALQYLRIDSQNEHHKISYLPSYLHLRPDELRRHMLRHLECKVGETPITGCLYGQCFADIDEILEKRSIRRMGCGHCYEMLMGRKNYRDLVRDKPGSFFLEKIVVEDFDSLCRIPLELDDSEMRNWYFEHYQQVVYIRQPLDPDLIAEARGISKFLSLPLKIVDADYSDLRAFLKQLEMI